MKPLFNVPGEGSFPLLMGIISGYPIGAKIVTNFRKNGICTKEEAERLITFTNNSGPLFIIGTVRFVFIWKYYYRPYIICDTYSIITYCSESCLDFGNVIKKKIKKYLTTLLPIMAKKLPLH